MTNKKRFSFASFICAVYILTIIVLAVSVGADISKGKLAAEKRFRKLTGETAETLKENPPRSEAFYNSFLNALGNVSDVAGVEIKDAQGLILSYPADLGASGLAKLPGGLMEANPKSTKLNDKDGQEVTLTAAFYLLRPLSLYKKLRLAFLVILAATLSCLLHLIYTSLYGEGEEPNETAEDGDEGEEEIIEGEEEAEEEAAKASPGLPPEAEAAGQQNAAAIPSQGAALPPQPAVIVNVNAVPGGGLAAQTSSSGNTAAESTPAADKASSDDEDSRSFGNYELTQEEYDGLLADEPEKADDGESEDGDVDDFALDDDESLDLESGGTGEDAAEKDAPQPPAPDSPAQRQAPAEEEDEDIFGSDDDDDFLKEDEPSFVAASPEDAFADGPQNDGLLPEEASAGTSSGEKTAAAASTAAAAEEQADTAEDTEDAAEEKTASSDAGGGNFFLGDDDGPLPQKAEGAAEATSAPSPVQEAGQEGSGEWEAQDIPEIDDSIFEDEDSEDDSFALDADASSIDAPPTETDEGGEAAPPSASGAEMPAEGEAEDAAATEPPTGTMEETVAETSSEEAEPEPQELEATEAETPSEETEPEPQELEATEAETPSEEAEPEPQELEATAAETPSEETEPEPQELEATAAEIPSEETEPEPQELVEAEEESGPEPDTGAESLQDRRLGSQTANADEAEPPLEETAATDAEPQAPAAADGAIPAPAGPSGLYSDRTGFGWEPYMLPRMDNEILRCTKSNQDISVVAARVSGIDWASDEGQAVCASVRELLSSPDLIFEKGNDAFVAALPGTNITEAIAAAEDLYASIDEILARYENDSIIGIGISARSLRMISGERLANEAEVALNHAMEDETSPIVAFKVDPQKYRSFLASQAEQEEQEEQEEKPL